MYNFKLFRGFAQVPHLRERNRANRHVALVQDTPGIASLPPLVSVCQSYPILQLDSWTLPHPSSSFFIKLEAANQSRPFNGFSGISF